LVSLRNKYGRGRAQRRQQGQLRIIGGMWRSRRLRFLTDAEIRPTPDRVRETVFNWLQEVVPGARCLDLFAGSGGLGLEALSRGAAHVTLIDQDARVIEQLQENLTLLGARNAELVCSDAFKFLAAHHSTQPFDIVFMDPPYRDHLLGEACARLESSGLLAQAAWIYLECGSDEPPPALPASWHYIHNRSAGQVGYHLAKKDPESDSASNDLSTA
jgi:16S rRNA (guanine966-N2)-methyltransferase